MVSTRTLTLATLTTLALAAFAPITQAQTPAAVTPATLETTAASRYQPTPFNLAYLAYRGHLKEQGIPSYSLLISAHRAGRISAEDVVRSAVAANRLSPETLSDASYVRAVETQLDTLDSSNQ
jgi:hypothetical protein